MAGMPGTWAPPVCQPGRRFSKSAALAGFVCSVFHPNKALSTQSVTHRRDAWDLGATSPPAWAALIALRAGWAARQKAADVSEDGGSFLDRITPQDDGMDIQGWARHLDVLFSGQLALWLRPWVMGGHPGASALALTHVCAGSAVIDEISTSEAAPTVSSCISAVCGKYMECCRYIFAHQVWQTICNLC